MAATASTGAPLRFRQIWNLSFGFFGIQFGWALQMANMSAIYEYLGAGAHEIPLLWLAAPLTGLLAQPVIGYMGDRTWNRLGRRRPYFLAGALLSAAALVAMPSASTLLMAAALLWVLDTSINICMEPFRALVADLLPEEQRMRGFAMQSLFIGLGAVIASVLPWLLRTILPSGGAPGPSAIPAAVRFSFYLGAVCFLGSVLYTIVTTGENPLADPDSFQVMRAQRGGGSAALSIWRALVTMPRVMRRLAWVQIFTGRGAAFGL